MRLPKFLVLSSIFFLLFLITDLFTNYSDNNEQTTYVGRTFRTIYPSKEKGSVFDTCPLPEIDPFNPVVLKYFDENFDPLKDCERPIPEFASLGDGRLTITGSYLNCKFRCVERASDFSNNYFNWSKSMTTGESIETACEFVEVQCQNIQTNEETSHLLFQIIKSKEKYVRKSGMHKKFNVFLLILDSVSSAQSMRALPLTLSYLEKALKAVTFNHLSKVGLNSRPNAMAMFFNKRIEEIDRSVFDLDVLQPDQTFEESCAAFHDNDTSVFSEFVNNGHKTAMIEDWMQGCVNWPNCRGFDKQPTNHYFRPYGTHIENVSFESLLKYREKYCIETYLPMLDYWQQFINAYPTHPKFAMYWNNDLGHDYMNKMKHADKDFRRFLMKNRDVMENSFVFLLADHGLRPGKYPKTRLGVMENNNPQLTISIPKELRKRTKILENLQENSKKLQTQFDVFATLMDLAKNPMDDSYQCEEPNSIETRENGYSLLRQQPNFTRSCKSLNIPFIYCNCQYDYSPVPSASDEAQIIGKVVIDAVNQKLIAANVSQDCIPHEFESADWIDAYDNSKIDKSKELVFFRVTVNAKPPSSAVFKSVVRKIGLGMTAKYEMASNTIERIDRYGRQGSCVPYLLESYCYCKSYSTFDQILDL